MSSYKVEKGIPMPEAHSALRVRAEAYPFEGMEVGDSFAEAVDTNDPTQVSRVRSRLGQAIQRFKRVVDYNCQFSTRLVKDKSEIRIWRVK